MADTWGQMRVVPPAAQYSGLTARALVPPAYVEPERTPAPPFFGIGVPNAETESTLGAAVGLGNDVAGAIDLLTRPAFPPDPTYDVATDPDVTGPDSKYFQYHLDRFAGVQSKPEAQSIMSRIDREEKQMETVARSGGLGTLAMIAAGVASPTVAIPIGGWLTDIIRFGRVGGIAVRAAEAAALTGGGVAAQEAVLQRAQETRSAATSFFNIAGASVLGAVLGGIIGRSELNRLVDSVGKDVAAPANVLRAVSGGAAAVGEARGTGELAGSLGVAETLSRLTPGLRTQTSTLEATRNTVRDLMSGEQLAENVEGIASSVGGSVEARVGEAKGAVGAALEELRTQYSDYFFGRQVPLAPFSASVARVFGRGNGRLSFPEFNAAVSDALLSGDVHAIPQVQQAAQYLRRTVFDPLRDEAMNVIPGFRDMVEAGGSADTSYLTRLWNRVAVRASRDELRGIIAAHFARVQDDAAEAIAATERASGGTLEKTVEQLSPQELDALAQDVIDNILGQSPARLSMPNEFNVGKAGPLKERALRSLPTRAVLKYVERDAEKVAQTYARTLAPDIQLTKKFGSIDLKDQIAKIRDEANARGKDQTAAVRARIDNQAASDIRDITAMRDRLRGTYRLPDNADGLLHRAVVFAKAANFLSSLGNMTLSSASDIGKPVFIHGLTRTMGTAFQPLVRGLRTMKLAAKDVKLSGTALDMIANDRALAFSDLIDEYGRHTAVERGVQHATRAFSFATLMAPWNATFKQFTGIITITRALEAIEGIAKGAKVAPREVAYLAAGGIDQPSGLVERIAAQFEKHGTKDGAVWVANTADWTDKQAVSALRAFINRDVDRTIVTPGVGDKPLWMSGDLGSMVGQFQAFAMSSVQKTLVSGLQQRDMAALNGLLIMLMFGAGSYATKTMLAGGTPSDDPRVWASEAVDNSGALGVLMNGDHILEKWTGDRVGLSALTGQPPRRYINVNAVGALLGPTAGRLFDLADLSRAIASGNITASDAGKIRRLLPLQNLFYVRWLFDAMEHGATNAFGIPARKAS